MVVALMTGGVFPIVTLAVSEAVPPLVSDAVTLNTTTSPGLTVPGVSANVLSEPSCVEVV
jgi:hypothetical protein